MLRNNPARVVLAALIAAYVVIFGTLTWRQQSNYATFGFDMGIYDQGIWLLSQFREPFVTVRGLNYFGHHANLLTLVIVPFYWLGAGPHFLYAFQTVFMALGAVPVFFLARLRMKSDWLALVPVAAFLLFPSLEWINWWHFHPDALIITPLLAAWYFAATKRWRWFTAAVAVALLAKEDAALAVIMLGVVLWFRGDRRAGWRTFAAGIAWWLICTRLIIPLANGGKEPFYEEFYPGLGDSMPEIVYNLIRHPSRTWELATMPDRLQYYRQLLYPLAGLPLLAFPLLVMLAPQLVANVTSIHQPTHDFHYHYSSVLVAVLFIATVEALGLLRRARVFALVALSLATVAASFQWSPIGWQYDEGAWRQRPPANHRAIGRALALVRPNDKVSASFYLVPHLTHRQHIYEFPNPFRVVNWAVHGEDPPSPSSSNTLVLDTTVNGDDDWIYESLVRADGPFRVVFEEDGVVVARRKTTAT